MNVNDLDIINDNQQSSSNIIQQQQTSPNSRKSTSKKRKLDDLGLENISDSENCPSKLFNYLNKSSHTNT